MKKNLLITILSIFSLSVFAQQDPTFTQYMFNTLAVNPAYAGSKNILTTTVLHRSQWIGFEGAPQSQTITLDAPFYEENIGLGGSITNDIAGPVTSTSFNANFSYRIKVTKQSKLAFGINAGMNMIDINLSQLEVHDANEDIFAQDIDYKLTPNFGAGLYYYTDRFYVGASVPKLLKNNFASKDLSSAINEAKQVKHYFVIAGATFNLNDDLKLQPAMQFKVTPNAPIQADITPIVLYQDKIWGGLMYRTGDAMGLLFGMYLTEQLSFGYSFDWSIGNTTGKYNGGSHEIMLRYDFIIKPKEKVISPRHF